MANGDGYLKLFRQIRDNWTWKVKPYDPAHAWIDFLLRANWHESVIPHPSTKGPSKLLPGEFICSKRELSVSWGWSRERVSRFIKWLSDDAMIEASNDATYTRIKVLNWNKFQANGSKSESTDEAANATINVATHLATREATPLPPARPIQERKEGKELEKGKEGAPGPSDRGDKKLLEAAYAKASLFKSDNVQLTVKEYIGFMENNPFIPYSRIYEIAGKLHALRESLNMNEGIPGDKIFSYAVSEALKAKAVSTAYVGKVIQSSVIKWREGALRF